MWLSPAAVASGVHGAPVMHPGPSIGRARGSGRRARRWSPNQHMPQLSNRTRWTRLCVWALSTDTRRNTYGTCSLCQSHRLARFAGGPYKQRETVKDCTRPEFNRLYPGASRCLFWLASPHRQLAAVSVCELARPCRPRQASSSPNTWQYRNKRYELRDYTACARE